jgi:hypothetical protein
MERGIRLIRIFEKEVLGLEKHQVRKSIMERYDIRLSCEKSWMCQWAIISISDDGMFNAQTDCGNFNYFWPSFGTNFKLFIIDIFSKDSDYLYRKIRNRERDEKIDVEKTIDNMKKRVIESRRDVSSRRSTGGGLTQEEARMLWDALDIIQSCHTEMSADAFSLIVDHELPSEIGSKVFSDEWLYEDIIVNTFDKQAKTFCDVVAPLFAEVLKVEMRILRD